jgi:hypothetical protein
MEFRSPSTSFTEEEWKFGREKWISPREYRPIAKSKLGGRCWRQGGLRLRRVPPSVAAEGHLENDFAAQIDEVKVVVAAQIDEVKIVVAAQIDEVKVVASLAADGMEEVCCLWSK